MKNIFVLFFLCLIHGIIYGQKKEYVITDFSENMYAKLTIDGSEGYIIQIINKKNNQKVITFREEEHSAGYCYNCLPDNLDEYIIKGNIVPYEKQPFFIYRDFNFDNKKDFAFVRYGVYCYNSPWYEVFLFSNGIFRYNKDFTDLAGNYCGMFNIDKIYKQILTFEKSGCCWHKTYFFKLRNNKPILVKEVEEDGRYDKLIEKTLIKGKWIIKKSRYSYTTTKYVVLQYRMKNQKIMSFFERNDSLLYTYTNKKDSVELQEEKQFFYSKRLSSISFNKGSIKYEIRLNETNPAIIVNIDNQPTVLKVQSLNENILTHFVEMINSSAYKNVKIID